jgi:hypothetical protein
VKATILVKHYLTLFPSETAVIGRPGDVPLCCEEFFHRLSGVRSHVLEGGEGQAGQLLHHSADLVGFRVDLEQGRGMAKLDVSFSTHKTIVYVLDTQ